MIRLLWIMWYRLTWKITYFTRYNNFSSLDFLPFSTIPEYSTTSPFFAFEFWKRKKDFLKFHIIGILFLDGIKYTILRFNEIHPYPLNCSTIFRIDGIDRGSIMHRRESHEKEEETREKERDRRNSLMALVAIVLRVFPRSNLRGPHFGD